MAIRGSRHSSSNQGIGRANQVLVVPDPDAVRARLAAGILYS